MTKQELIHAIQSNKKSHSGLGDIPPIWQIAGILDALADVVIGEMSVEDGEIPLPGLGKLKADVRAARTGRNPATGAAIEIPARNIVKFSASKVLKDALA